MAGNALGGVVGGETGILGAGGAGDQQGPVFAEDADIGGLDDLMDAGHGAADRLPVVFQHGLA